MLFPFRVLGFIFRLIGNVISFILLNFFPILGIIVLVAIICVIISNSKDERILGKIPAFMLLGMTSVYSIYCWNTLENYIVGTFINAILPAIVTLFIGALAFSSKRSELGSIWEFLTITIIYIIIAITIRSFSDKLIYWVSSVGSIILVLVIFGFLSNFFDHNQYKQNRLDEILNHNHSSYEDNVEIRSYLDEGFRPTNYHRNQHNEYEEQLRKHGIDPDRYR